MLVFYASTFFQGLALVSLPAVSIQLTRDYGLTDAEYGASFLPQLAGALAGALLAGSLARRVGLKLLLLFNLLAVALSQALLATVTVLPAQLTFAVVLAGTSALGLGFGFSGAPMNSLPPAFFPRQPHGAVVAAHMLVGLGLALGPLLAGELAVRGVWVWFPLGLAVAGCTLVTVIMFTPLPGARSRAGRRHPGLIPPAAVPQPDTASPVRARTFWMFVWIVVLYALAEGTFSSWAVIYLRDARGVPELSAGHALSVFWAAVVLGRLAATVLVARLAPTLLWVSLPVLMLGAFLAMPLAADAVSGIALFAVAGLACSAFLPLTITLASQRFPDHVAWVASMLIAALMVGVGVGSFAVGALRAHLSFTQLYLVSALYPATVLLFARPLLRAVRQQRS